MGTVTPWGLSDNAEKIAPGIMRYDTPSHGGYHLSAGRMKKLNPAILSVGYGVDNGWFEEDCDWAFVVLAFPEFFTTREMIHAREVASLYYPNIWKIISKEGVRAP